MWSRVVAAACLILALYPAPASALNRFCDTSFEDCRSPILELIRNETVGIDVAFWFMEDTRYASELIRRWQAGVPVRVLMDTQAISQYGYHGAQVALDMLRDAGIPMREKTTGGILHWKMMLFAGQNTVEFSAANYSSEAYVPIQPYVNYVDEIIYFTEKPSLVNSFKTQYDTVWTTTNGYTNYANVTTVQRNYPTFPIDPELNFVPYQNFRSRSVAGYNAETQGIDAIMYRITDRAHTDALIAARARGIPVRLIAEPAEYRSEQRLWDSWNIDRLYMAGVQIRMRAHAGLTHEKLTILRGQQKVVFGSSNWTSASAESQLEHNLFTTDPAFLTWTSDHFERKWANLGPSPETKPFTPLPPNTPALFRPSNGATGQPQTVTLQWWAGLWAHKYDVLLGTDPSNLTKILDDRELGPSETTRDYVNWMVSGLAPGTTYYWRVVSRTMANQARTSATFSFTTAGTGPGPGGSLPSGWSTIDVGAVGITGAATHNAGTFSLSGSGSDIWGSSDQFRFAYQTFSGDGEIVARVASISGSEAWTKAGVMLRESLAPGSRQASMLVSSGKGLAFQRRTATGGASTHTGGGSGTAPFWVKLTRAGTTISAYTSSNGSAWTLVGSDTIAMGTTILAGLALTSHNNGVLASATFDNVSSGAGSTPPPTLPTGWSQQDIGSVGAQGSASFSGGAYTVRGAGADIWGTSDAFQFVHRTLNGNGTITARVASVQNVNAWTKAGVMIRAALTASSRHAMMIVSPGKGLAFQRRVTDGGTSTHTTGGSGTAPRWVRLQRSGNTITASISADGSSWTTTGTETIALPAAVEVGLVVSSHVSGTLATSTFDNVTVTP